MFSKVRAFLTGFVAVAALFTVAQASSAQIGEGSGWSSSESVDSATGFRATRVSRRANAGRGSWGFLEVVCMSDIPHPKLVYHFGGSLWREARVGVSTQFGYNGSSPPRHLEWDLLSDPDTPGGRVTPPGPDDSWLIAQMRDARIVHLLVTDPPAAGDEATVHAFDLDGFGEALDASGCAGQSPP